MCCFSGPVKHVSSTRIFAREGEGKWQYLVYEMRVEAPRAVAMILPLPVDVSKGEQALRFINLEKYPALFYDLDRGFRPVRQPDAPTFMVYASSREERKKLPVFEVGSFEASFVPTIKDFDRLDERFRLPEKAWEKIPDYKHYGFAVFKLMSGRRSYHPMAFIFERANTDYLFFPTMHIHDRKVHKKARFDHLLYCQPNQGGLAIYDWGESYTHAQFFTRAEDAQGIVAPDQHCYRRVMKGRLPNQDTLVPKAA